MCSKIANVVFVMVGYTVALTGLGCGKSCEDVGKEMVAAVQVCTKDHSEAKELACCTKKAYQTAIDEDACDDLKTSWEALLKSSTDACAKVAV